MTIRPANAVDAFGLPPLPPKPPKPPRPPREIRLKEPLLEEPAGFFVPPHIDDTSSVVARKMRLERFNEACDRALDSDASPLIVNLLDDGAMSVIYGESNAGKTFAALDMAFAVATGLRWNGHETRRGLVIYVAAEGGKRITRRLAALRKRYLETYGDTADEPSFALLRFPIDLRNGDANLKELLALVREAEAARGEKCVWLIVDTLSRAMAGGDENSSVDMGKIVSSADRFRAETKAHFSYVHHTGKDAARGARGHSLLRAATDTEIEVAVGAVTVTKQRDMDGGETFGFSLVDLYLGDDASGLPVKSAVVEWFDAPNVKKGACKGAIVPARQRLLMDVVVQAIDEAGEMFKPFADGATVKAVAETVARARYYAAIAEEPKDGDTAEKLAERQRKAFSSAIKSNLDSKRLMAAIHDGKRLIWKP